MRLFYDLISRILPENVALAHCDIPCGIYDPHGAQMAAHTALRMTRFLVELDSSAKPQNENAKKIHDMARVTRVKEKHGQIVEEELGTLDNDYFKPEHHKKFPELKSLIEQAIKLSITTRQNIDEEEAKKLVELTLQIAEIFYKTKNLTPVRVPSGYPTEGEIVVQK